MHSYAIIVALLFVSFGFTSAYANETFVDPDSLSFGQVPQSSLPRQGPIVTDPLTGDAITFDKSKSYTLYSINSQVESDEKQLVHINGETFYIVPDTLDRTANILAVLLLGVLFGLVVYRLSDADPIPLKYAKLSGIAVAFAMVSLMTTPIAIGNNYWGFAYANSNPEINIPEPVDSLYFDTWNFSAHGGTIINDGENSAISLDGLDDYLVIDSNLPEKLDKFTVSAWVKPDYKRGAPATLSIVSEADAFSLSINNDKVDKNVAVFSVYDGIKWHKVPSKSVIPEQWTHISATYSENGIKIFVNGIHENSQKIDGDYSLTYQYGVSTQNSYDYISSQSDVLVGAFTPLVRDSSSVQNYFSGLIDDITLYDTLLSSDHISAIDENNRTPDTVPEPEVQSVETTPEQTGTENEYGFTTADENPNDQKIEEVAAEGYKVKKPEEHKKKDKQVETPENQASDKADAAKENSPSSADHPIDESDIVTEFDEAEISTSSESSADSETIDANTQREAPLSEEMVSDGNSLVRKLIRVSTNATSTFSDLPTINSRVQYEWKLYGNQGGEMVDLTNDPDVNLQLLDLDSDNRLDRAEWNTTDGITEYYLVAKIILATDGLHLDSDRDYVDDIFYEIRHKDGIWTYPIPEGDYVRVTFEYNLTKNQDITVYAKSSGSATIEVYEKDGTELLATFETITTPATFVIYLSNLVGMQDTFDLKIIGAPIQFDQIKDPATHVEQCKNGKLKTGMKDTHLECHMGGGNDNNWITGNVNGQKSHWFEGQFLPYRAIVTGVDIDGTWQSLYAFDTAKQSEKKHAIDYISNFNLTETTSGTSTPLNENKNDPCRDLIPSCTPSAPDAISPMVMPLPAGLTSSYPLAECAGGLFQGTPILGKIVGWITPGATLTINSVDYTSPSGTVVDFGSTDCPAEFEIVYDVIGADSDTVVIFAWSGHVSSNEDTGTGHWGSPNAIPTGSPYHMRVGDITDPNSKTTNIGNQELQLSASAIIRPSQIIIEKITIPDPDPTNPDQEFNFTTTGENFNLFFNLTNGGSKEQLVQTNLELMGGNQNPPFDLDNKAVNFTVSEDTPLPLGWLLTNSTCIGIGGEFDIHNSTNLGNPDPSGFLVGPGETVICTFENTLFNSTLIVHKDSGMFPGEFQFNLTALSNQPETPLIANLTTTDTDGNSETMNFTAWSPEIEIFSGSWNIAETLPAYWQIKPLLTFCNVTSGPNQGASFPAEVDGTVNFDAGPNDVVECFFVDDASSFLTVHKHSGMFGDTFAFNLTAQTGQQFIPEIPDIGTADQGEMDFIGWSNPIKIQSGNWTLEETLPDHWKINATQTDCLVNTGPSAGKDFTANVNGSITFEVFPSDNISCNFYDDASSFITIHKDSGMFPDDFQFNLTALDSQLVTPLIPILSTTDTDNNDDNMNFTAWSEIIKIQSGNWTIDETLPSGDWKQFNATCNVYDIGLDMQKIDDIAEATFNVTEPGTDQSFVVEPWQLVECEFVNDASSFITIHKDSGMFPGEFQFNLTALDGQLVTPLIGNLTTIDGGSMNFTAWSEIIKIQSGNWTIDETLPSGFWKQFNATCNVYNIGLDMNKLDDTPVTTFNVTEPGTDQSFVVAPWQLAECEFVNDASSFITIHKDSGMFPGEFQFNLTALDGQLVTPLIGNLTTADILTTSFTAWSEKIKIQSGNWTIDETLPSGFWKQFNATCNVYNIDLDMNKLNLAGTFNVTEPGTDKSFVIEPWQLAECTFVNELPTGKIIIIKDARPDDGFDFPFTINSTTLNEAFELDDCNQNVIQVDCPTAAMNDDPNLLNMTMFTDIPLQLYNITEHIPDGVQAIWKLSLIECVSSNGNSTIGISSTSDAGGSITVDLGADDVVTCTFTNDTGFPTRTQGYWKTHTDVTENLFENPPNATDAAAVGFTNGTIIIGSSHTGAIVIDNIKEVFGLYWGSIPKMTDGSARSDYDQTIIIMIHQLLTAQLNCGAFGCSSPAIELINTCNEAFATGNLTTILMTDSGFFNGTGCTEELDNYNNSGETFEDNFPPGASPSASKDLAAMTIDQDPNPIPQNDFHKDETGYSRWDDLTLTDDFDGDGHTNWFEIEEGTNPLDPDDFPII